MLEVLQLVRSFLTPGSLDAEHMMTQLGPSGRVLLCKPTVAKSCEYSSASCLVVPTTIERVPRIPLLRHLS